MILTIPRNLLEFSTPNKDCFERAADYCLKLPRLAGSYRVTNRRINPQLDRLIAKIFAGIIGLILLPIVLLGLFFSYLSSSHSFKYLELENQANVPIFRFHRIDNIPVPLLTYVPMSIKQKPFNAQTLSLTYVPTPQLGLVHQKISSLYFKPIILPSSLLNELKLHKRNTNPLLLTYVEEIKVPKEDSIIIQEDYLAQPPIPFEIIPHMDCAYAAPMNEPASPGALSLFQRRIQKMFSDPGHDWKRRKYELVIQSLAPIIFEDKVQLTSLDSPIAKMIVELYKLIESKGLSPRDHHHAIVGALRIILDNSAFQSQLTQKKQNPLLVLPEVEIVLKLCNAFYKNVEIHSFCSNLVDELLLEGSREIAFNLPVDKLSLEQQFEAIERTPHEYGADRFAVQASNLSGASGIAFDPATLGNISHLLYTLPKSLMGKPVDCLRFGNPTISGLIPASSRVDPIFEGFLASLMIKGEKHVYFSLQDGRGLKSEYQEETGFFQRASCPDLDRTCKILALEKRFPGHFFPVVFAQDSCFYKQKEEWAAETLDGHKFKHGFLHELTDKTGKSGFYFPEILRTQQFFGKVLPSILDDVHEAVFGNKLDLSLEERKDFIEISYVFIELYILQKLNPDSFNNACKDAIDRAGKLNRLVFDVLNMLVDNTGAETEIETAKRTITHAPAFLVKKQAMVEERRHRLITALDKLQREGVKDKIRKILQGCYGFTLGSDRLILPFGPDDSSL